MQKFLQYSDQYIKKLELSFIFDDVISLSKETSQSWQDFIEAQSIKFQNVPFNIIISIANNCYYSYLYAKVLNFINIPDEIIKSIARDSEMSYCYAYYLKHKNVPNIIVESISRNKFSSLHYLINVSFKNTPLIILKSLFTVEMYFNKYSDMFFPDKLMFFIFVSNDKRFIL